MYNRSDEWYDLMQVCENGHLITAYGKTSPEDLVERCPHCGAPTITHCKHCGTEIRGDKHIPGVACLGPIYPPTYCHKCGKPYPWIGKQKKKKADVSLSPLARVQKILQRFHIISRQLRNRHSNRQTILIEDEYDVQDLLHALLKLEFDDIRPEEWSPSYAGSASKMDFLLKKEQIVVETKKTRKGLGSKEVGEELIIDITKYKEHPDCKTLVCFVYDPEGRIGNPEGLKRDLEKVSKELKVIVYIYP